MTQDEQLKQAVALIKGGNKSEAVPILKGILKTDRNNELAWLWLSTCADKPEDKIYCFQEALRINPSNEQVKKSLKLLESNPIGGRDVIPKPQPAIIVEQQSKPELAKNIKSSIEFIPAICPNCGGELRVPEDRKIIKCMYCGYDIIMHETQNNTPQPNVGNWLKLAEAIADSNPEEAYGYYAKVLEVEIENWKAWYGKAKSVSATYDLATSESSLFKFMANTKINEIVNDVKKAIEYCPENEKDKLIDSAGRLLFVLAAGIRTNLLFYSGTQNSNGLDILQRSNYFFEIIDYLLLIRPINEDYIPTIEFGMSECKDLINMVGFDTGKQQLRNRYQIYLNKIKEVDPTFRSKMPTRI